MIQASGKPTADALLDIERIGIAFGGLKAVDNFSLQLPAGKLYGLIGPNGAGKTTVFNLLTGVYHAEAGSILLEGRNLVGRLPHQVTAAGIARTFQNIRLFPGFNVLDNVRLACQVRGRHGLFQTLFRTPGYHQQETFFEEKVHRLLKLFDLEGRAYEPATSLSYGHQRQLEIIRALATDPKVLLLDEPAAGMNLKEKRALATAIQHICDTFHVAILLIDHDMGLVMDICERVTVLDYGLVIAEGVPAEIQNDPKVIAAYLGDGDDEESA